MKAWKPIIKYGVVVDWICPACNKTVHYSKGLVVCPTCGLPIRARRDEPELAKRPKVRDWKKVKGVVHG